MADDHLWGRLLRAGHVGEDVDAWDGTAVPVLDAVDCSLRDGILYRVPNAGMARRSFCRSSCGPSSSHSAFAQRVGLSGTVSVANSLVGTTANDVVGSNGVGKFGVFALSNGNYAILSYDWTNGAAGYAGAVSLGHGTGALVGPTLANNSGLGLVANDGSSLVFAYGATRDQLVVGQPAINTVSLFDGDFIFGDGF